MRSVPRILLQWHSNYYWCKFWMILESHIPEKQGAWCWPIDGLAKDCGNSIELPQSCAKPSKLMSFRFSNVSMITAVRERGWMMLSICQLTPDPWLWSHLSGIIWEAPARQCLAAKASLTNKVKPGPTDLPLKWQVGRLGLAILVKVVRGHHLIPVFIVIFCNYLSVNCFLMCLIMFMMFLLN